MFLIAFVRIWENVSGQVNNSQQKSWYLHRVIIIDGFARIRQNVLHFDRNYYTIQYKFLPFYVQAKYVLHTKQSIRKTFFPVKRWGIIVKTLIFPLPCSKPIRPVFKASSEIKKQILISDFVWRVLFIDNERVVKIFKKVLNLRPRCSFWKLKL